MRYYIWSGIKFLTLETTENIYNSTAKDTKYAKIKNMKKYQEPDEYTDQTARNVIGAAIEVHKALGPGFLESVYESALAVELKHRNIPFKQQYEVGVTYRGEIVGHGRLDFFVDHCLVVELKAIERFEPIHYAQVISYLKVTGCHLGLLLNFNVQKMTSGLKRVVYSP